MNSYNVTGKSAGGKEYTVTVNAKDVAEAVGKRGLATVVASYPAIVSVTKVKLIELAD